MFERKVAMINDYISSHKNQVMRGRIDERNATGQKVLCQIRLIEMINKNRNLVDMDDLRCVAENKIEREREKKRRRRRKR